MAEYIERSKVIELLKSTEVNGVLKAERIAKATISLAIEAISNDIPAADVAEVKHGRWTHIVGYDPRDAWAECSRCRTTVKYPGTKYCPHCGAKMDEEMVFENGRC